MNRRGVIVALWLVFAGLAWNVMFDRLVWTAATDFTREQVRRHEAGEPVASIHDAFSPRVRAAAVQASLWTLPIIAAGAGMTFLAFRRTR